MKVTDQIEYKIDCKLFDGYKPCIYKRSCINCPDYSPKRNLILIINLDAMGNVLMTTAILKPIKREFPQSTIFWLTEENALKLLDHNPYIDRVIPMNFLSILFIESFEWDLVLNIDKTERACALTNKLKSLEKRGFGLSKYGTIIPLNPEAIYWYRLGLEDNLKFIINKKSGQEILVSGMGFKYARDPYILNLSDDEIKFVDSLRTEWELKKKFWGVGINTGCASNYPLKKLSIENHKILISKLLADAPRIKIFLLGGKEETQRNREIASYFSSNVYETPTQEGLRRGISYIGAMDVIITGDTLSLHIGCALGIYTIAYFTITCDSEIDLFDHGIKIKSNVSCRPCWRRFCDNSVCLDNIDLDEIVHKTVNFLKNKDCPA